MKQRQIFRLIHSGVVGYAAKRLVNFKSAQVVNFIPAPTQSGLLSPAGAACMIADAALLAKTATDLADLMEKINEISEQIKQIESQCPINDEERVHNMEKVQELKNKQVQMMIHEGASIVGPGLVEIAVLIGCAGI